MLNPNLQPDLPYDISMHSIFDACKLLVVGSVDDNRDDDERCDLTQSWLSQHTGSNPVHR